MSVSLTSQQSVSSFRGYERRKLSNVCLFFTFSFIFFTGFLAPVYAESEQYYKKRPLDVRVDRLERLMSSQKQLELLYRMKQLQEENQQLRALLEEQSNEVRQLKLQQRELYTDLNRRLSNMEGNGFSGTITSTSMSQDAQSNTLKPLPEIPPANIEKLPGVVDKSTFKESQYGVTQREEILVSTKEAKPSESTPVDTVTVKPSVYKKVPMTDVQRKAEQKMYQSAYNELRARQYNKARDSFVTFISKYPGGRYAHIAQYWIAESSYAQQNYKQAVDDYQLLLDIYPLSPKKAEAELKKAYSHNKLGNINAAKQTLNSLLLNYPDTTEAGQAKRFLKQL